MPRIPPSVEDARPLTAYINFIFIVYREKGRKHNLVVIHVCNNCLDRVENPVVDHGIHSEGHRVRGEDLLTRDLEHLGPDVDDHDVLQKWKDEDETRTSDRGLEYEAGQSIMK